RVAGIEKLFAELGRRIPIQAQVTLDVSGRMLLGTGIASAMTTLEALKVDVIGLNCSTGPEHMREPVRYLSEHATLPLSVIPNAEEHTSELQSRFDLVCRLLLEKKKTRSYTGVGKKTTL